MISLKNISTLLIGLLLTTVSIAQPIASRTLVKSFNLLGNQSLVLDLPGPVEVQTWNNTTVRVQMEISVKNRPDSFLKSMITAGRYNLKSEEHDGSLTIFAPGMEREVKLKNDVLQESISYLVFVPESVHVIQADAATSALEALDGNTGKKITISRLKPLDKGMMQTKLRHALYS